MTEHRPLTPARLRSQRRNAQRSTGPITIEGRRRAKLNGRRWTLSRRVIKYLKLLRGDARALARVRRDVLAVFHFMGAEMEPLINVVAWEWWLKQHAARRGAQERTLRIIDARLEAELSELAAAYRLINRQWRRRFMREIGSSGRAGMWHLRLAVETRLPDFQELSAAGKLPEVSPLEAAISRMTEMTGETGLWA